MDFEIDDIGSRPVEIKRRKTLEDYEVEDMQVEDDNEDEMLFR